MRELIRGRWALTLFVVCAMAAVVPREARAQQKAGFDEAWNKGQDIDLGGLDNLAKFVARMEADAAVRKVLAEEAA